MKYRNKDFLPLQFTNYHSVITRLDIISFDEDTKFPATIIVDLEAFRNPIKF